MSDNIPVERVRDVYKFKFFPLLTTNKEYMNIICI